MAKARGTFLGEDGEWAIWELSSNLSRLPPHSRRFASSLIVQYNEANLLSKRQWEIVESMLLDVIESLQKEQSEYANPQQMKC